MSGSLTPSIFMALAFVALIVSVFVVLNKQNSAASTDNVPIRLGVIILGAIALVCVGGLFYVGTSPAVSTTQSQPETTTPQPSDGGNQSRETGQTPGEAVLLQGAQPEVPGAVATAATDAVSNAATDAQALGLTGQIVSLFGTVAGAAVAGIAGLLVGGQQTGSRMTDQEVTAVATEAARLAATEVATQADPGATTGQASDNPQEAPG